MGIYLKNTGEVDGIHISGVEGRVKSKNCKSKNKRIRYN